MLEKLISSSLKQNKLIIIIALIVASAGIYSFSKLSIDAFPDVTNVQIEIVINANGLSAFEIEKAVTFPIENALRGLPDLIQMRSTTKFGLSVITVVFEDNVDIYFARQIVHERMSEATKDLPEGVDIEMGPIATAMGEIYQYTLMGNEPKEKEAKKEYLTYLRTLEEWTIDPILKSIPGVSEINSFGGYLKQYQVIVKPELLLKYNVSVNDVFSAVENNNNNVGGNTIDKYSEQYIVRGVGLLKNIEDMKTIVIKSSNGTPVYIKDVAEVKVGEAVRQGAALINSTNEAVGGVVMMLKGSNGRDVVKDVKEKVKDINANVMPNGIKIVPYYDRTDIVDSSISTVMRALAEGSIIVLIILYLLLRNIRGSLVVLIALPLSLLITFIVMKIFHIEANLMSLGGLAISIGMIIDATIIQVENVQRNLSLDGKLADKYKTVLKAVLEVRKPSIFGELIIALTFIPVVSLEGIEGKMFTPLAVTVGIALLSSLLISIFIIPALTLLFLKSEKEKENKIMDTANKFYAKSLTAVLKNKKTVFTAATGLFIISLFVLANLGTEFIPIMDEGAFDMDVQLMPGVSLDKAMETNRLVSKKMKEFPELITIVGRTGQSGIALEAKGTDKTGFTGILKDRSEWTTTDDKEELTNKMRESLSSIPGIVFSFSQPIQCRIDELVAGTKAQLIIKIFGEDLDILKEKAEEVAKTIYSIPGAADIIVERIAGQPYLDIDINRSKIARYGLNVSDVSRIIEIAIGGKTASLFYEENKSFDINVRFDEKYRNNVEEIGNILIPTPNGYNVPLNQVADIAVVDGPVQISRENGQRRIGIELNIKGRDIGSFVAEAKQKIKNNVLFPTGYYTVWGGQFESQQRAMNKLLIIFPLTILLIFSLLYFTFRSFRLGFLIIFNLPFALIGGVFALYISGLYLSVPASIGFIVLFGVAVLNGVVMVSYIQQLHNNGMPLSEAIKTGSEARLRPVLMTASISAFSLIPMLYATGPGSEIQKPLAVVVIGGLITSTILTLYLLPTLYYMFENLDITKLKGLLKK